jgi:hypothetical protein
LRFVYPQNQNITDSAFWRYVGWPDKGPNPQNNDRFIQNILFIFFGREARIKSKPDHFSPPQSAILPVSLTLSKI